VQQADGAGVQAAAEAAVVVPAEAVLVPSVVHGRDPAGEHEQERRQRAKLVDAHALLQLHPLLDLRRVARAAPPREVQHHDARVEVAGAAAREGGGQRGGRPEPRREVGGEVGAAVLRRRHGRLLLPRERGRGEGRDVVGEHDVGVEVHDAAHAGGKRGGEVGPRVVERAVQRAADGGGDEPRHAGLVGERVDTERQRRERRAHRGPQLLRRRPGLGGGGGDEVEVDGLRARRVAQHGEHGRHGAAQVRRVQRHGHVHRRVRRARRVRVRRMQRRRALRRRRVGEVRRLAVPRHGRRGGGGAEEEQ